MWKKAQQSLPICCVDILPVMRGADGTVEAVGLIYRDTPHEGRRWCLVGGRLFRDESFAEAITRQIHHTLGVGMKFELAKDLRPAHVAQYFTEKQDGLLHDPRQHAVSIIFAVAMEGIAEPCGEALDFRWYKLGELAECSFGFGQGKVVAECLRADSGFIAP